MKRLTYCFVLLFIVIIFNLIYLITKPNKNTCILLTTTVNVNNNIHDPNMQKNQSNYRLKQYLDVINKYLDNSKYPIYVVESSGYNYPEYKNNPRVNIYSFNLNIVNNGYVNKSPMEALSIIKAYEYFGLNKYENIIKITGKYYIPNIDFYLNNIDNNYDLYLQNYHIKQNNIYIYQSTELFGFKSNMIYIFYVLAGIINDDHSILYKSAHINKKYKDKLVIETYVAELINNTNKIYRFPKLKLEKPIERGCNNCKRKQITHL